jgi:type IV secretory pathway VirB3-like protein
MEDLETDILYLAATRPPMIFGVPLTVFCVLLMMVGLVVCSATIRMRAPRQSG